MALKGNTANDYELRGKLHGLDTLRGYSAYETAVMNGFDGTEEEWLASLGVQSVEKTSTEGLVDTYTMTLYNGNTLTFTVTNGAKGEKGEKGDKGDATGALPEVGVADNGKTLVVNNGAWVLKKLNSAKIGEVTLLGNGWVGDASPYSQVVALDGVTENSQVDLTPSVEQLAVFYQKDLAFVTENEDGVVTVYAIGQKPENDYTIQVTITEVEV